MLLGARQFFERRGTPTPPLPYDAVVEYLESTGTQYILSQYKIIAGNIFELDISFVEDSSLGSSVMVGRNASNNECFIRKNGSGYFGGGSFSSQFSIEYNTRYKMRFDLTAGAMSFTVDDTLLKSSSSTQPDRKQFPLFAVAATAQNNIDQIRKARIYSFKSWSGGELVEDWVSVRFTNELGQSEGAMYDRVSRQLFRNQGTGAFTIGPDKTAWTNPYVADGLVAMWDGEWNADGGVHDQSATAWKDLIGNLDATAIDSPIFGDNYTDTSNGYWTLPSGVREIVETQNLTAEAVFQASSDAIDSNQGIVGLGSSRSLWLFFGNQPLCNTATLNWQVRASLGIRVWYNSGVFGTSGHSSSIVNNDSVCNAYLDSALCTITPNVAAGSATSTNSFFIGRIHGYNKFHGKIYCVRLYSRALTAEEIAANYAIDKARFNLT